MSRKITRSDVMAMAEYGRIRRQKRREVSAQKRGRRVDVGPHAIFYFENYDTMWLQIHEMLYAGRVGEARLEDELSAYNPLIPQGEELVATLVFEIDDRDRRQRILGRLGGVEETISLRVAGETVHAVPEQEATRSEPGGKTPSVHFLHFPFLPKQIRAFRQPQAGIVLAIDHADYRHTVVLPEAVRTALAGDFD